MNVAVRVDATAEIGTGHMMRCLSLADGLRRRGATIRFVSRRLPGHLQELLLERAYEVALLDGTPRGEAAGDLPHASWLGTTQAADAEETASALAERQWDWLVVDHYALDARWEAKLRGLARRILAIDNLADRAHDCDALLDQNLNADMGGRYAGKVPPHCLTLMGPRYALLRDEFQRARKNASPRTGSISRVLVSFGGVDAENRTGTVIEALLALGTAIPKADIVIGACHAHRSDIESACQRHGFRCHVQTNRMAELMAAADLAIGAGGITTWERCCMGVPALAVPVAANQQGVVAAAALEGLLYTPATGAVSPATLALHVKALLDNPRLLEMISRNGMRAVDGRGVDRVVRLLDQDSIRGPEATIDDTRALFEWRNDETIRRVSRRQDVIAWQDHQTWFRAALADDDRVLLIGERNGAPVGVVRFDVTHGHAEVSIYRVPGSTEPGLGPSVLAAAETWLTARRPDVASITAEVLGDNESSHHLFRSTGYRLHSTQYTKHLHLS